MSCASSTVRSDGPRADAMSLAGGGCGQSQLVKTATETVTFERHRRPFKWTMVLYCIIVVVVLILVGYAITDGVGRIAVTTIAAAISVAVVISVMASTRPTTVLTLDTAGLRYGPAARQRAVVDWDAIEGVEIYSWRWIAHPFGVLPTTRFLSLIPVDPTARLWRTRRNRVAHRLLAGHFPLPDVLPGVSLEQIAETMLSFRPELTVEQRGSRSLIGPGIFHQG